MSSLSFHDKQHVLRLLQQQGQVKRIFDDFTRRSGLLLTKWTDKSADNVWVRNATLEKEIDKLLTELHDNLLANITNNTAGAWEASNLKNDDLLKAFIKDMALPEIIGKSRYEKLEQGMFSRNMDALKAFQQRKIDGLTLSDTVWKSVDGAKENLEYYLFSGISTGRPAATIASDIRQLLDNPDKRFRRIKVKDEQGRDKFILSKPMQDYHPGQGVYRSSYKNALRIAATETNQSYRLADYERWSNQGFVLGIEVHRSKSNKGPCPICDPMVGKYPPDYKFLGNHPWCICFAVPIMLEGDELIDYLLTGVVPEDKIIKTVPQSAIDFVNAKEANKNQWFVKENKEFFNVKDSTNQMQDVLDSGFKASKSVEEAVVRAKEYGFKNVDFGKANVEQANVILEVLHKESLSGKIEIRELKVFDSLSNKGEMARAVYSPDDSVPGKAIHVSLDSFKHNNYRPVLSFQEEIALRESRITSANNSIDGYKGRMNGNPKTDKVWAKEIKSEQNIIASRKREIEDFKRKIENGERPIPESVSSTFKSINDQVKSTIHHEIGHYVDEMVKDQPFSLGYKEASKYGNTDRKEFFAEWYAHYRMYGEKEVPDVLMDIFKKWENRR